MSSLPPTEDECALPCQNGGTCVFEEGTDRMITRRALLGEMVQKCDCPAGFTGLVCNIPVEICQIQEDGQRVCPNGQPCTENRDSEGSATYSCECSRAEASSKFAGYMCNNPVTEYCGTAATSPFSFCTHGGSCLNFLGDAIENLPSIDELGAWTGNVEAPRIHDGCRCAPEYTGKFCEYLVGTGPDLDEEDVNVTRPTDVIPQGNGGSGSRWSTGGTIGISMGAVGLLAAIAVVIFVVARRKRRSERSHVLWTAVDEFLTKDSSRSLGGRSRRNASSIGDDPSDPRGSKRGGSSRSVSGRRSDMSSGQSASRSGASRSGTSGSRSGGRSSSRSDNSTPSGSNRSRPLTTTTSTSFRPIGEMTVGANPPKADTEDDVYELRDEDLMDSGLDSDTVGHTSRSGSEYTR